MGFWNTRTDIYALMDETRRHPVQAVVYGVVALAVLGKACHTLGQYDGDAWHNAPAKYMHKRSLVLNKVHGTRYNTNVQPGEIASTDTTFSLHGNAVNTVETYYYMGVSADRTDVYIAETTGRINGERPYTAAEKARRKATHQAYRVNLDLPNSARDSVVQTYAVGLVKRGQTHDRPHTTDIGYFGQTITDPAFDFDAAVGPDFKQVPVLNTLVQRFHANAPAVIPAGNLLTCKPLNR